MNCEYILVYKDKGMGSEKELVEGPFHASTPEEADEKAQKKVTERQRVLRQQIPGLGMVVSATLFRGFKEYDGESKD